MAECLLQASWCRTLSWSTENQKGPEMSICGSRIRFENISGAQNKVTVIWLEDNKIDYNFKIDTLEYRQILLGEFSLELECGVVT